MVWEPFRELDLLQERMDRLMRTMFAPTAPGIAWSPFADVEEIDEAYLVELELPGVRRDDVTVEVIGTELVVHGEIKEKERAGELRRSSRRYGRFDYRLALPAAVEADQVSANLAEGVLTLRIPKMEKAKPHRVKITS